MILKQRNVTGILGLVFVGMGLSYIAGCSSDTVAPRTTHISNNKNDGSKTPVQAITKNTSLSNKTPASPKLTYQVKEFGKSVEGRPLQAYIFGNGPDVTMFFGAFHGNEPESNIVALKLIDYIKKNPKVVSGKTVIIAPEINPDGLRRNTRMNAHQVDINRNFPGTWEKKAHKARYNPGPYAASEPETKAVIRLMEKYKPGKAVSIHAPLHTMNYTGKPGRELAMAMKKQNHYPVTPDIGYPTPGSFGDYCGIHGVAIVTLELPSQSPEKSWIDNRDAFLEAIRLKIN